MKSTHLNEINSEKSYILAFDCLNGVANVEANISLGIKYKF